MFNSLRASGELVLEEVLGQWGAEGAAALMDAAAAKMKVGAAQSMQFGCFIDELLGAVGHGERSRAAGGGIRKDEGGHVRIGSAFTERFVINIVLCFFAPARAVGR